MDETVFDQQPGFKRAVDILNGHTPADLKRGIEALKAAIAAGEPDACCLMAALTADGVGVPQSWPAAFDLLLDAAMKGSTAARRQLRVLTRTVDGELCAEREERGPELWRRYRQAIRLEDWIAPSEKQVLSKTPRLVAIKNFLPPAACAWLIDRALDQLRPALLYGTASATPIKLGVRTNSAFEINTLETDMVVLMVKARIAATIGFPTSFLEPPQILHYDPGEQFAPHRDYLDPTLPGQAADFARRGQRVVTFLVYLNAEFEGGETDFPVLALAHKGQAGDALYFGNVDPSGQMDPRTLHAGLPPISGEKWLFSQWVRNRPSI
jgi:prolyl 4-hydroxylase